MNWMGRRIIGKISTLSPIRLKIAIKVAGNQNVEGMFKIKDEIIKTSRIPIPPPFGVSVAWELRPFGLSISPHLKANLLMIKAPAPPATKQTEYKK